MGSVAAFVLKLSGNKAVCAKNVINLSDMFLIFIGFKRTKDSESNKKYSNVIIGSQVKAPEGAVAVERVLESNRGPCGLSVSATMPRHTLRPLGQGV